MNQVLHIVKSLGRGGAEMLLQETLKQHDRSSFEFHYIYFLPWKNQMVEGLEKAGGTVHNFPAKNNLVIMLQARKIANYIRKHKIELVHCHLPWAGFVGRIVHKMTGIPVIYSEHNKQERYHAITKTINKLTFNWQNKVIAVSADVAESIQTHIHPKIPVQTILNGVDTTHFQRKPDEGIALRKELGIEPSAIIIGTIAVFRFQKRLKEWIDVFKLLEAKNPGIRGIIVGDGILNEEIRAYLKEQGMEGKILMPGLKTNVIPWFSAMDIFMMTSSFEGLPIALLEAMSMECVVVCTDAGGIKELIRNQQDGFLVPVDQWKDIILPLEMLISDPGLMKNYAAQARQRVVESFSMKAMVQQTEAVYFSIIKPN
jgi:glycosyltransferase involved in cell wall biosynthesis